jgi:hypothetical protein
LITRKKIILHEILDKEASEIPKTLKKIYEFNSQTISKNIDGLFTPIPEFDGFQSALTKNMLKA